MRDYPSFVENKKFMAMHDDVSREMQIDAMLHNIKRVHFLSTQKYQSFGDLIHAYLNAGREIFGLETGIVSQIEDGIYTVKDVISDQDIIHPNDKYPLEGTYCYEVHESKKVLGFPEVGSLPFMKGHPVYVNLKLEAYLSAPIFVVDKLYGTLNFTSTKARLNGFSEHERDLITLMADAIGNYILLREREQQLLHANRKLNRFVAFVAHDLRNPLGSINLMAKMADKDSISGERRSQILQNISTTSQSSLELVHAILDISALRAGKLIIDPEEIALTEIIEETRAHTAGLLKEHGARLTEKFEEHIHVYADKSRLVQALTNLLINSIKYSPDKSDIEILAEQLDGTVKIRIRNSKIGQITNHKFQQSSKESVGFGLEIADEIMKAHDGKITINESENIFEVALELANSKKAQ